MYQAKGEDELTPVEEVLKVIRASLALIGNSSNYVSQLRRKTIIEALPADKANLAKIMKQVCKRQIENLGSELFRDQAIKAVSERVNTLETFSKTTSKSEVKLRQQPDRFLLRGPSRQVQGRCGHNRSTAGSEAPHPVKSVPLGSAQPVRGKLRYHPIHWKEISDSNCIVQTARGYRLELICHPLQLLPSTAAPIICRAAGNTGSGGVQSVAEKSNGGMLQPRRFLQLPFYRPQKGWRMVNYHHFWLLYSYPWTSHKNEAKGVT